jgi:hypothetical protein
MPVFQGSDEESGEKRDIIRPRLASRLMSIFLAVYRYMVRATKTKSCAVMDSLARNLPGNPIRHDLPGLSLIFQPAIPDTEQRILATHAEFAWGAAGMPGEEWVKTLAGGRTVKFIYQELPGDGAFMTAQVAGNEVVYSIVLAKANNPLSREDVESHFKAELAKK